MRQNWIKTCLLTVSIISLIKGEEETYYKVTFWSMPVVNITMKLTEADTANKKELTFRTKTTPLISRFFSVDNEYKTIFNVSNYHLIRYEKDIDQSNLKQKMVITWNETDSTYNFEKKNYTRTTKIHNIFSLLMRSRSAYWDDLDTKWWDLDHEGTQYKARYLWIDSVKVNINGESILSDRYRLDLIPVNNESTQLVEKTDVFSWGIILDDCIRQIWIERNGKRRILRAEVKVRGLTISAELKND